MQEKEYKKHQYVGAYFFEGNLQLAPKAGFLPL